MVGQLAERKEAAPSSSGPLDPFRPPETSYRSRGRGIPQVPSIERLVTAATQDATHDLDALERQLGRLVRQRQELRAVHAGRDLLEPNRREIVRLQQRLAAAMIARHLPRAA